MGKRKAHLIINGIEYKECSCCKKLFTLDNYHNDPSKWDGLHGFCKECTKVANHKSYEKNPQKKYEKVLEYQRRTGLITKYKPYNPKYYSSEVSKRKKRARDLKRRAIKEKADIEIRIFESVIQEVQRKYNYRCAYCGADCSVIYHIDHKLPLIRGGGNNIENLALSCPHCNYSKHDKTDVEFCGHPV